MSETRTKLAIVRTENGRVTEVYDGGRDRFTANISRTTKMLCNDGYGIMTDIDNNTTRFEIRHTTPTGKMSKRTRLLVVWQTIDIPNS